MHTNISPDKNFRDEEMVGEDMEMEIYIKKEEFGDEEGNWINADLNGHGSRYGVVV